MRKAELIITLGTILSLLPSLPKYILHRRPLTSFACGSIQIFGEEKKKYQSNVCITVIYEFLQVPVGF